MQFNRILKGLAIALPMMTLAACSSTDSTGSSTASQNQNGNVGINSGLGQTTISTPIDQSGSMTEQQLHEQQMKLLRQEEQTVFFKFDNAEIQPAYQNMLEAHAEYLRNHPNTKVVVQGHADERGTPEYNIALGERRATAVSQYLQALGVSANQMSIVSYGEEKPLLFGHTDADYAKNRRAVIVY
ncbi:peptidoglycan-associated lipoprotein Pal [Photobacterium carnosum]|uniref:peptidoglycan-associated lipoprotein Pal n=1 Tax=Photobacterium carnosum TaxID=2023717 RepID=UPI001E4F24A7|nr:peptidoglycan-associated lipoprotein Pal [Photobacterium carnosum]MCD9540147.1 peptidoglycan-associated lipoprotein Pal [Photobacterium carnosum]MCD9547388.1 peptidoglycan-associated lipoprotein Pal [Photobacterium carnosum]MCF2304354.1 peptidoglycan-associated lipoprotein Pal [Photobacterium carnosum]